MKNNNRNIIIFVLFLFLGYLGIGSYLVYDEYSYSLDKTIKTSDYYCQQKANEISSYINRGVATANVIADMLSSAKDKYGFDLMPFVEQGLQNVCISNPQISSITVTWEYSAVCKTWSKPFGRLVQKSYMYEGLPKILRDTVDLEGEYVSENYYQLKNGASRTLFSSPEINSSDYMSQTETVYSYTVSTRIMLDGIFLGMITVEMPIRDIDAIIEDMPLEYAGKPFVIGNNGKIFCHINPKNNTKVFTDQYKDIDKNDEIAQVLNDAMVGSTDYEDADGVVSHLTLFPIFVQDNGKPWTLVSEVYKARIRNQSIRKAVPFALLSFMGLLILVVLLVSFARKNNNPMQKVIKVLKHIDDGDYDKIEHLESSDEETNSFYVAVNTLASKILQTTEFARSMGRGELNTNYDVVNPNALDLALLGMQANLKQARIDEENRKQENEKLSWSQNGLAQLGEYLRMNNADISEFAYNVVSFLVKYVNALQGGLFISEEQDNKKYLSLKAAYAFDRKKQLEGRVEFGESLVGRCAIEGKTIFLTDVPDGYLYITSGLGENKPQCILLVPLKFEDEVHGVIEIASLHMIEEYQITFFNNVAERIASSISNIKKNINTAELLNKFRTQSDELSYREAEIEKALKKIESNKEDVGRQQFETTAVLDALSNTCIITQYDVMGMVLELRDKYLDETGYKMSDIVGHNLKEILALTKNDMDNFDKFWNDIIQGKSKSRKFARGEMLFKETFTLLKDEQGRPYKVISIALPK